ncbi:MAG: PilN domain-containing protein [Gemmatimonadaceae bacterium]
MSGIVGIELTEREARGVRLGRWTKRVTATHRVPWNPARPADALAELRAALGPADRLAIAVGLGLLELKRVDLPPAPTAERERMLQLEPDRYFASADQPLVTGLDESSGLAFAIGRDDLTRWLAAISDWAPVERIEPTPVAVARVVSGNGHYLLDESDTASVIELRDRQLRMARRLPPHVDRNGARPLPTDGDVTTPFQAALGAARGIDGPLAGQLATPELRADTGRRRQRRVALLGMAAAASVLFAGWSYEQWQVRSLAALSREAGTLTANAAPALEAQTRLRSTMDEIAILRGREAAALQPLEILALLSRVLPPDAVVTSLRMQEQEWQVEGSASDASSLVPRLDSTGRLERVRSVAATSRFRDGARMRESFAIAFGVRHAR